MTAPREMLTRATSDIWSERVHIEDRVRSRWGRAMATTPSRRTAIFTNRPSGLALDVAETLRHNQSRRSMLDVGNEVYPFTQVGGPFEPVVFEDKPKRMGDPYLRHEYFSKPCRSPTPTELPWPLNRSFATHRSRSPHKLPPMGTGRRTPGLETPEMPLASRKATSRRATSQCG